MNIQERATEYARTLGNNAPTWKIYANGAEDQLNIDLAKGIAFVAQLANDVFMDECKTETIVARFKDAIQNNQNDALDLAGKYRLAVFR